MNRLNVTTESRLRSSGETSGHASTSNGSSRGLCHDSFAFPAPPPRPPAAGRERPAGLPGTPAGHSAGRRGAGRSSALGRVYLFSGRAGPAACTSARGPGPAARFPRPAAAGRRARREARSCQSGDSRGELCLGRGAGPGGGRPAPPRPEGLAGPHALPRRRDKGDAPRAGKRRAPGCQLHPPPAPGTNARRSGAGAPGGQPPTGRRRAARRSPPPARPPAGPRRSPPAHHPGTPGR